MNRRHLSVKPNLTYDLPPNDRSWLKADHCFRRTGTLSTFGLDGFARHERTGFCSTRVLGETVSMAEGRVRRRPERSPIKWNRFASLHSSPPDLIPMAFTHLECNVPNRSVGARHPLTPTLSPSTGRGRNIRAAPSYPLPRVRGEMQGRQQHTRRPIKKPRLAFARRGRS